MRREWFLSLGAVALAFLSSQHHNLMMLLFAVGLSNAGMSLMTQMPWLRDAMLLMSIAMASIIAYQIARPQRPTGGARHGHAVDRLDAWHRRLVPAALRPVRHIRG